MATTTIERSPLQFKPWMAWLGAAVVILLILASAYNSLVDGDIAVKNAWGEVPVQYQRRFDVASQEAQIVGAAANHETEIFQLLSEQNQQKDAIAGLLARYKNVPLQGPEAAALMTQLAAFDAKFQASQIKFAAYVADNPDIQSMQLYLDFQTTVEGSENRIGVARKDFNTAVTAMQGKTRRFPGNLLATCQFLLTSSKFPNDF